MRESSIKFVISILSILIPFCANTRNWNFGVEAGYLTNTMSVKEYKATARNGFRVGANAEYSFANQVTLTSGIDYLRKGVSVNGTKLLYTRISRVKLSEMDYLQIPITMGYKFYVGSAVSIRPHIGGYYAVGIAGDSFVTGTDAFGQPNEKRVRTFGTTDDNIGDSFRPCNRNDAGLVFGAEFAWMHFGLNLEYDLGLVTASYYGNGKQRTFSVTLTYWLF